MSINPDQFIWPEVGEGELNLCTSTVGFANSELHLLRSLLELSLPLFPNQFLRAVRSLFLQGSESGHFAKANERERERKCVNL